MSLAWKFVKPLKDQSGIAFVEKEWKVKLPPAFIELVTLYNSGVPEKTAFDTANVKGRSFGELLDFNLDSADNVWSEYKNIEDKLPPAVFPFAADPGGNYICFDYRKNTQQPRIVFWDHEERFIIEDGKMGNPPVENESDLHVIAPVADELNEFLALLYTSEIEDDDDFEGFELL